jgi:SAM-dependent methyltransferase
VDLLAEKVGPSGRVVGVEIDGASVARARAFARERRLTNVEIMTADARHTGLPGSSVDLVHARLLLANIPAPGQVVAEMARLVRPGGWVALTEPDISLTACYPPHSGLEHLTELLLTAYRHEGADPHIGRRLPHLLATAGLEKIVTEAHAEVCPPNHAQRVVILDLARNMRAKILARGLIREPELDQLDREARLHLNDPATLSLPVTYFLAWARKVR